MNCPNCGAPMNLVRGRDYFSCDYCATFQFATAPTIGSDGVRVFEQLSGMQCPFCATELHEAAVEGHRVLHCERCNGVLTTNDEFLPIVRKMRARAKPADRTPTAIQPEELKRQVDCPNCRRTMDTHPYYGPGAVVVDTCARCHLIWLDKGELNVIRTAPGRR